MISGKNKELYYTSSIHKKLNIEVIGTKIVIDNSMRERDTFTLTESLNDGSELKFGSCLPNQISFIAHDMPAGLVGKTLRPVETLEENEDDPFTYGEYKIFSAVPTADRTKRQVTAYDAMYDIINADVKAWYDGLKFPMTLKQFRDSFFSHLGIEQEETSLVNDSMTVNKTLVASSSEDSSVTAEATISGKTIIEAICEINGAFGNINRDGKFEYVILPNIISAVYPAEDLYPRNDLFPADSNTESMSGHYITFDYEDFQSKAITQLEIRASDNTAGAIVGTAGNNYVISGNFLVSDKTGAELEQIANNVFPIMKQAAYTPLKTCTCVGNPCLELGDPIRFNTTREIVETYILQRTLAGVQSKRDSIAAQGTETHTAKVNSMRETLVNVQRRTSKLERNADHLVSQYEDLENSTSSMFEQTAEMIQTEVSNRQNTDNEMSTRISQTAHSISITTSGGDKSVGIKVQLYDENGNLIGESSDDANIIITGFVSFYDLLNEGSTSINGANIKTGTIDAERIDTDKLVATNGQFTEHFEVGVGAIKSGGLISFSTGAYMHGTSDEIYICYRQKVADRSRILVDSSGIIISSLDNIKIGGNVLFGDSSVYIGSVSAKNAVARIGDIPSTSSFARVDSGGYVSKASFAKEASYVSNTASAKHTANMYSSSDNKMYYCPQGSSRRYKTDVKPVQNKELDPHKLYDLNVVQFKYKPSFYGLPDDSNMETVIGFIAEDVNEVYPCACEYDEETGEINNWLERYVIPPMLALVQEQHKEIEQLKLDNFSLKGEVDILKQRLGKMEEMLDVINSKIS